MSYFRLYTTQNLTIDQKKSIVKNLNETCIRVLNLTPEQRQQVTVHFDVILPENISVGGIFVSEKSPAFHLEIVGPANLAQDVKDRLAQEITVGLTRDLKLTEDQVSRLGIHFMLVDPKNMAMGGQMMYKSAGANR